MADTQLHDLSKKDTKVRRFLIAGNWKMNLLADSARALVRELTGQWSDAANVGVAVCPPSVYLTSVAEALKGSVIGLGAQNMYSQDEGAYTGEVSGKMLRDVGCQYVILGHSERRTLLGESDAVVNQKLLAALRCQLTPIVCVGETLAEREGGRTQQVVESQCRGSLAGLSVEQMRQTVLAYEPVWAIGTGKTATPGQAEEVHAQIRSLLTALFGEACAQQVIIQYGGSVKADNALELLSQPNIDGALVGGASLKADQFLPICRAANTISK
jgi:triosephosphate isomerase